MYRIPGVQAYVTFQELGGRSASEQEVIEELAHWPLDGVLGFLGKLSLEMVQAGREFSDPVRQAPYLNCALVDSFPTALPGVHNMYVPGHIPATGGRHLLLTEQNLAWLTHAALLHAQDGLQTAELGWDLRLRMCRLLLIVNDSLVEPSEPDPMLLRDRREFALNWLRYGQFQQHFESVKESLVRLARQWVLMVELLPEFYPKLETHFLEATNGVGLHRYFEVLALVVAHIRYGLGTGVPWLSRDTLCSKIKSNHQELEQVLGSWVQTPTEYRRRQDKWIQQRPTTGYRASYDYVLLRERPLIEARPGELICPVLPFLLGTMEDGPYFVLSNHLSDHDRRDFQKAIGDAYEKYARSLVDQIAQRDAAGTWQLRHSVRPRPGTELADSYLQRGDVAVSFEHKGQRPGTDFLRGGSGERALGPSDALLARLEAGEQATLREGAKSDHGLFTYPMWQQSKAGPDLLRWAEREFGTRPRILWPIITHLSGLRIDEVVRKGYLNPLIQRAGLYPDASWGAPQWAHASDLEWLAALAEAGDLDLVAMLNEKADRRPDLRFDLYLQERFGQQFLDHRLGDVVDDLLQNAVTAFSGEACQ